MWQKVFDLAVPIGRVLAEETLAWIHELQRRQYIRVPIYSIFNLSGFCIPLGLDRNVEEAYRDGPARYLSHPMAS
jgi:hypothetical protein